MFCEVNLLGRVSKEPKLINAIKSTNAVNFSVAYNSTQKKQTAASKLALLIAWLLATTPIKPLQSCKKAQW